MNPGIHPNISDADYRKWPGLSQSMMRTLARSAAHLRYALDNPSEPTPAMVFGQALHTAILEPGEWFKRFAIAPDVDRRTKDGKAAWADFCVANAGKAVLKHDEASAINPVVEAINAHPMAAAILKAATHRELSVAWNDKETGTLCKGRMDLVSERLSLVADIKTTDDASPEGFARSIHAYGYHVQASHYLCGLAACGTRVDDFVVIAVEKDAPHAVGVYRIEDDALGVGRAEAVKLYARWDECNATGKWPAYSDDIQPIGLPVWAMRKALSQMEA